MEASTEMTHVFIPEAIKKNGPAGYQYSM
jgi:hypothetical protein